MAHASVDACAILAFVKCLRLVRAGNRDFEHFCTPTRFDRANLFCLDRCGGSHNRLVRQSKQGPLVNQDVTRNRIIIVAKQGQ